MSRRTRFWCDLQSHQNLCIQTGKTNSARRAIPSFNPHPVIPRITSALVPSQFPASEPPHMFNGQKTRLHGSIKLWSDADRNQEVLLNQGRSLRNAKQADLEGKNERCGLQLMRCTFCLTCTLCRVEGYSCHVAELSLAHVFPLRDTCGML